MRKVVLAVVLVMLIMSVIVPAVSAAPPASGGYWYKIQKGDTLAGIAYHHGVKLGALIHANGIKNPDWIYAGQNLWIPDGYTAPAHNNYHKVKYGETLIGIAAYYGVSPWAIAKANGLYNLNLIYAGQKLYIPW